MDHTKRSQILQQVERGEVPIEDAINLMSTTQEPMDLTEPTDVQRWLRVRVTNLETDKVKVNVNIPLNWIKFGFAMGARFAPELDDLDIDEMLTSLDQSVAGRIIEVEDVQDNQRVEIYIE